MVHRKREFLVHWEGYSDVEDSWIKEVDRDDKSMQARGKDQKDQSCFSTSLVRG